MRQLLKKRMKDQKGFTLIELLAVIVILGILAAIAVPSIINIINNSKVDAHIANAQQMANSAKLYINEQKINITSTPYPIKLSTLISDGLLDAIKDPEGSNGATYDKDKSIVNVSTSGGNVIYSVTLVSATNHTYTDGTDGTNAIDAFSLQRGNITP